MPSWPASLMISAKRKTTSVIGFCRPVRTFASLIGFASGSTTEESFTWAIRSMLISPLRVLVAQRARKQVRRHVLVRDRPEEAFDRAGTDRRGGRSRRGRVRAAVHHRGA